jgi:chromate reductase
MTSLHFVTLVGSIRKGSYNAAIARGLQSLASTNVEIEILPSIGLLPIYDADLQAEGFPDAVTALGAAIKASDGLIIVTPEYNYSVPGGLKNAIDWLSRLPNKPFATKPILIQSASMGVFGGVRAQYHLRQIMVFLDAFVMNVPEVMVSQAQNKIDATTGEITDQGTKDFITGQLKSFEGFVRRVEIG